jgi:hypothetical protein
MLRTLIDQVERVTGTVKVRACHEHAAQPTSQRHLPPASPRSIHGPMPLILDSKAAHFPPRRSNDRPPPRRWCVEAWRR